MLSDIHMRVLNAKYVLERAARMQDERGEMSLSVSLLLMHDAVELLMLSVLDHLQISAKSATLSCRASKGEHLDGSGKPGYVRI